MKKISLITLLCLFAATISVPFASAVRKKPKQEPIAQLIKQALEKKEKSGYKKKAAPAVKKEKSGDRKSGDKKSGDKKSGDKKSGDKKSVDKKSGDKKPIRIAATQLVSSRSSGGQVGGTPVPDSGSSLILLGMGALGIYAARRFRNRK